MTLTRQKVRRRLAPTLGAMALLGTMLTIGNAASNNPLANAVDGVAGPLNIPASTQFDLTGIIQRATVDTPANTHSGGTLTINGHIITIPAETVVILPASALTWQELFRGGNSTGLALADGVRGSYEAHVIGNRVVGGGSDKYIAGLVNISQQDLNAGAGYVNFIDYNTGSMYVGGTMGSANGARIKINDPATQTSANGGRYGRASGADQDPRFQVDQDNPTILAETGFPMCIPRVDPTSAAPDTLCPQNNRPVVAPGAPDQSGVTSQPNTLVAGEFYKVFRMDLPVNVDTSPASCLRPTLCSDPRIQAPFEIGDYVNFAGTLANDGTEYISAHTIVASLGIYTQFGVDPAYVTVDVSIVGTGGLTVFGAGEAAVRTKFEGMTTDESRSIHVYGVDMTPGTGATTDRDWGAATPDQGPPTGAVRGRWRLRPPCTGTVPLVLGNTKVCAPPPGGNYIPPTREVRATVEGLGQFVSGSNNVVNPNSQVPGTGTAVAYANGIFAGQYHAPIDEYIFPENVPGAAMPENNFNTLPFLAQGGYSSVSGVVAGQLSPWPSSVVPAGLVCATPTITGAPYNVAAGGTVQLSGSVNAGATTPVTLQWTAGTLLGGTDLNGALTNATTATPTFNSLGLAAGTYNVRLSATNGCGTVTADATVVVAIAPKPTIAPIAAQTVTAGTAVVINASSASLPAPTWTWAQPLTNPAQFANLGQVPGAATASATSRIAFTPTVAGTYTFTVTATNINGTSSVVTATVTVTPVAATNITLTPVEYRISKQRLVITATTTAAILPTDTVALQPYLTETGTVFDPVTLGAANLTVSLTAPNTWTITAVGAPKPACNLNPANFATPCAQRPITVKANRTGTGLVGTSAATALDRIRQ